MKYKAFHLYTRMCLDAFYDMKAPLKGDNLKLWSKVDKMDILYWAQCEWSND